MSVMNGFRSELINKIVGFNAHITVKPYENIIEIEKLKQKNLKLISKFNNTKDLLIEMKNKNLVDIPVVEPKFEIINGEAKLVG